MENFSGEVVSDIVQDGEGTSGSNLFDNGSEELSGPKQKFNKKNKSAQSQNPSLELEQKIPEQSPSGGTDINVPNTTVGVSKLLIIGDVLKSHQMIYKKQTRALGRFNSDQELVEAVHLAGVYTAETILKTCASLCDSNSYQVHGPYSRLQHQYSSNDEEINEAIERELSNAPAIDTYVCGECEYRINDSKQRTAWRAVQDLGINIKQQPADISGCVQQSRVQSGDYPVCFVDISWYGFGRHKSILDEVSTFISSEKLSETFFVFKCKNRGYERTVNSNNEDLVDKHLCNFLNRYKEQCLVVLSIEELRQAGYFISQRISWERTLQNLLDVLNLSHDEMKHGYKYLTSANQIVITCGPDAAIYYCRERAKIPKGYEKIDQTNDEKTTDIKQIDKPNTFQQNEHQQVELSCCLYFAPEGIEGDLLREYPHRMRGFDTLIACSIVHHLMKARADSTMFVSALSNGILYGLKAARFLQIHGFDICEQSDCQAQVGKQDNIDEWLSMCEQGCTKHDWVAAAREAFKQYNPPGVYGHKSYYYYPYNLVSSIIVNENVVQYSWFSSTIKDEQAREELRKHGERIQQEWNDAGWVLKHDFQKDYLEKIIHRIEVLKNFDAYKQYFPQLRSYSPDDSYFDKSWWTFYRSSIADFSVVSSEHAEEVSKRLAKEVLKKGPEWLTKKMLTNDERSRLLRQYAEECNLSMQVDFRAFPVARIGKLWLIGRKEIESYRNVSSIIGQFLSRNDKSPVNIGVFGPPGAGKSFGINELIKSLETSEIQFKNYVYNLSQFTNPNYLVEAFDEIQEAGLLGQVPVVFWDEYDTDFEQPYGWLKYFIGPMQDGEYFTQGKICKLPKSIFVFAGSRFHEYKFLRMIEDRIRTAQEQGTELTDQVARHWRDAKGIDFKSRLVGIIDIPDVNFTDSLHSNSADIKSLSAYFRRAIVLRSLLEGSYPDLFNSKRNLEISDEVASAFISVPHYYHGARSIEKILNMCSLKGRRYFDVSCLPAASQLRLHVPIQEFERHYLPGHSKK